MSKGHNAQPPCTCYTNWPLRCLLHPFSADATIPRSKHPKAEFERPGVVTLSRPA